ncbi:MAG: hypothetical protein J1F67_11130 [Muribaculaceae bacterium]|nr:hypothetical protein [Muribaculaceae bacterium]
MDRLELPDFRKEIGTEVSRLPKKILGNRNVSSPIFKETGMFPLLIFKETRMFPLLSSRKQECFLSYL